MEQVDWKSVGIYRQTWATLLSDLTQMAFIEHSS